MSNLTEEIKSLSKFPRYLREFVVLDFSLFLVTAFWELAWLAGVRNTNDEFSGTAIPIVFITAIFLFLFVGLTAILDVSNWMKIQFEKATAEKTEVEKVYRQVIAEGSVGLKATVQTKKEETKKASDAKT